MVHMCRYHTSPITYIYSCLLAWSQGTVQQSRSPCSKQLPPHAGKSQTRLGARRSRWRARAIFYPQWAWWAFAARWQFLEAPGLMPQAFELPQPVAIDAGTTVHSDFPQLPRGGRRANWAWEVNWQHPPLSRRLLDRSLPAPPLARLSRSDSRSSTPFPGLHVLPCPATKCPRTRAA
jgi:hypothetical protein